MSALLDVILPVFLVIGFGYAAVRAAIEDGSIDRERVANFLKLSAEIDAAANQLATLEHIDLLSPALPGPPDTLPALADPPNAGAPLTDRARAWLHTNCAQCHRPGGPTPSSLDLRATTALAAL